MAGKSDPSIYNERTSIGSSDDLDEYGVWVKTGPQDLSSSLPEIEELPDFDSDFAGDLPDLEDVTVDELDIPDFSGDAPVSEDVPEDISFAEQDIEFEEIPEDLELPEGPAPIGIDADGFTEVSMDDFLDISEIDSPESIDFGDLDSSVSEIEMLDSGDDDDVPVLSPAAAPLEERHAFADDLSTQLLQKIADELSSIKKEISGLKNELSVVRGEVKVQENADAAGFFGEEDDEKIALTGDELDNILNTANFTEETGAGEGIESGAHEEAIPVDSFQDTSVNDDESAASIEINFDEDLSELDSAVSLESETSFSDTDDFEIALDLTPEFQEDSDELNLLREEGALPLTEAPEDTSYLDEAVELSGAEIPEPEAAITENPVSEPVIDNISIDLDMEEAVSETASPDDFVFEAEETLELPAAELPELDGELPSFESTGTFEDDLLPAVSDDIDFSEVDIAEFDEPQAAESAPSGLDEEIPNNLKQELKTVLSYMDQLLESLPEEKIEEFAKSEYFETYKKLFEELGLV